MNESDDLFNVFDLTDSNDPIDQHLIDLFNAARADATTEELAAESNIVSAMQQAMTPVPSNVISFRSNSMRQRFVTSKAATKAAIISGVVLFSATAAAAGGVLPDSAQSAVSRAVSHIGIDISNPEKSADDNLALASDDTATDNSTDSATENSFDDNSFDDNGGDSASRVSKVNHDLCEDLGTTESTTESSDDSATESTTPSQSLDDVAAAAGMTVTDFCASVSDDSSNGVGSDSSNDSGDDNGSTIGGHGSDDAVTSSSIDDSSDDDDSDDSTESTVAQVTVPGQITVPSTSIVDESGSNKGGSNSNKNKNGTSTDSNG